MTKNFEYLNEYESAEERERRIRNKAICDEYVARSGDIITGGVAPNRVLKFLSDKYMVTIMGVKGVLKREGLYKSAKQPVILKGRYAPKQASLF